MIREEIKNIYNTYLSQSSVDTSMNVEFHDNSHDNSSGSPDYHNDSHDNTPSMCIAPFSQIIPDYHKQKRRLQLLKLYLSQSSTFLLDEIGIHDNSHDNTPSMHRLVLTKNETN